MITSPFVVTCVSVSNDCLKMNVVVAEMLAMRFDLSASVLHSWAYLSWYCAVCFSRVQMITTSYLSIWDQLETEQIRGSEGRHLEVFCGLTVVSIVVLVLGRLAIAVAGLNAASALHDERLRNILASPPASESRVRETSLPNDSSAVLKFFQVPVLELGSYVCDVVSCPRFGCDCRTRRRSTSLSHAASESSCLLHFRCL